MSSGLVSVIIPVYNGARWLGPTIESVLAQDHEPVEIIVIDDGSTDASAEVARSYAGVRCLVQPNRGPAAARNAGMRIACGQYLAFLDADDLMPPTKLSLQVGYLETHPEVAATMGRQQLLLEEGVIPPAWAATRTIGTDVPDSEGQPFTIVMRRQVLDAVGPMDERLRFGEDTDWILRIGESGVGLAVLDEIVLVRRLHGANMTYDAAGLDRAIPAVLKLRLDRKRALASASHV